MKNILQSTAKVRFQDCDPFNHLYNTRYLDYFLNTREDQLLDAYKLDVFGNMNDGGFVWLVSSNQICYLKPANMGESIVIDSQLIEETFRSLVVEMRMWDEEMTELKAMLLTKFVYYNIKTQKPALHPEPLSILFKEIVLPVAQNNFEERKTFLIRQIR